MAEKNLPPTESRKRQARENGQVGVSQDSLKILRLLLMAELAFASEPLWRGLFDALLEAALQQTARPRETALVMSWDSFVPVLVVLLVLAVLPALVAMLGTLAQTRFNVAGKALGKGFDKLNPGANLKSLISGQKLLMAVIGPVRSTLLLTVAWLEIRGALPNVAQTFRLDPAQGWEISLAMLQSIERQCIVVLVLLIVTDILLQRYLTYRQLRMDLSEVRRDHKQTEGDPMLKGTRRQLAQEIAMSEGGATKHKPSAVVVNPEHVAVSLFYDPEMVDVPLVLEKRSEEEALELRRRAREAGVPVVRYKGLARYLLASGEVGQPVPDQSLRAVALLLRVIEEYEKQAPELLHPPFRADEDESRVDLASIDDEVGQEMLDLA